MESVESMPAVNKTFKMMNREEFMQMMIEQRGFTEDEAAEMWRAMAANDIQEVRDGKLYILVQLTVQYIA